MRPTHPRGTTLIEAMAAMAVFVIGILGVMQMNVLASAQNNLALQQTTASRIARDLADALERVPITHPMFDPANRSSLAPTDAAFANMDEANGRVRLQDAIAMETLRPLLGSAHAVWSSEGMDEEGRPFYEVAWRSALVPNTGNLVEYQGNQDSFRILIMVRFPTNGGVRQINFWTVKYEPNAVTEGTGNLPEI